MSLTDGRGAAPQILPFATHLSLLTEHKSNLVMDLLYRYLHLPASDYPV